MTKNKDSYNKIASKFLAARKDSQVPLLIKQFANNLKTGDSVLDVGCGVGLPNAQFLVKKGFEVTGIDNSENMIYQAQKLVPKAKFICSDIFSFKPENKFVGIVAWDSLFHLAFNQQQKAFGKISSMLKPEGYFVFTHGGSEGKIQSEMFGEKFTYSSPGPEKVKLMLTALNFRIIEWELDLSEPNGYLKVLAQKTK